MVSSPALDRSSVFLRLLLPLAFSALLAGCSNLQLAAPGSGPQPPSGPPPNPGGNGTVTITPQVAAIAPGQTVRFSASATNGGAIQWSVSGGGAIDQSGNYTAPPSIVQSENVTVTAALSSNPAQDYATAVVSVIQPGTIACPDTTGNPQVAQYTVYLPAPGNVQVDFGPTSGYGRNTWRRPTPSANGGQVQLWVAGMLGNTRYHIRGTAFLSNGAVFTDADQTCTTGTPPPTSPVQVTASGTPQPGIELWNTVLPMTDSQAFATDLSGNVIWTYAYKHSPSDILQGVQLLPNGNLLMLISFLSSTNPHNESSLINEVREVDLAGNTIRSVKVADLNTKLAASTSLHDAGGAPYNFRGFHHDVVPLPNGHLVILADYAKVFSNLPGASGPTAVLGDAIVDVDPDGNPDWVWSSFDHLDINRHPMNFPDWTHSNNMLYSADDHNLLLSMRHQNWIIKIEFLDGLGSGKVLWHLGKDGDFKLINGTDPTDWFYAQHGMNYASSNTTGVFRLVLMDNGNDRFYPSGQVLCNPLAGTPPPTCYSTIPVIDVDERAMTATLVHHYQPGPADFSYFGGNAELLANGDFEAAFASTHNGGIVQELDPNSLNVIWQAATPGASQYHVNRWASLYPGVQW
ncbi:aryl-sulfate sulfotransferase [Occallatibacter riparius]|uniref:Aryl-sulfate sulfotransferase n=1 Tax=Occallatibacter riparius TaxID=1002689 RepID=A0A9J7BT81_9BACT|nr:aryl-sulfate sulfotransferase [Occallatibacter riparius]UWZ84102.1 aryl-sulfate sulfotransferase [Occallatibacter riparius]